MALSRKPLPIPPFFKASNASDWNYRPNLIALQGAANEWKKAHGIKAAATDQFRIHLLLIDVQKDFCFPEGTLYVGGRSGKGAIEDSVRIAQFIYKYLPYITDITTTLDTHFAQQIFFGNCWVDQNGEPLASHRILSNDEVQSSAVLPNPAIAWLADGNYPWLCQQFRFYSNELALGGKYPLYLWPPHCVLGSDGHPLVGVINEARMFHSYVRGAQSNCEVKGGNPFTENYSVYRPEVLMRWDGKPLAQKNVKFLEKTLKYDVTVVMGQAASHCVKSSVDDVLDEIKVTDPMLAKKIVVAKDCMSAVVVPGVADYTEQAEKAIDRYRDNQMRVVNSTDPLDSWVDAA